MADRVYAGGASSADGSGKYKHIMSLRDKRHGNPPAEIIVFDSDGDEEGEGEEVRSSSLHKATLPLIPIVPAQDARPEKVPGKRLSDANRHLQAEENKRFVDSDEDLSPLENFVSIYDMLARGGDEAKRADFILNQFGKEDAQTPHGDSSPKPIRTKKSPTKVPGLDPSSASSTAGLQARRRLGASRMFKSK